MKTKQRNGKDKWFLIRYGLSEQTFSFKIKLQAEFFFQVMTKGEKSVATAEDFFFFFFFFFFFSTILSSRKHAYIVLTTFNPTFI